MESSNCLVILTGAGISAESGIRTFRDSGGLWEEHRVEEVASPHAFVRDPSLVHRFYNLRRRQLLSGEVLPNAAHEALARLEREYDGDYQLITQNVDDLHERAGSRKLIHMHGELLKVRCERSGHLFECRGTVDTEERCPCCDVEGTLRPHIVWFGEMPLEMDKVHAVLASCSTFVAIGTSGNVYPAAGFVELAAQSGARTVELNLEPSSVANAFDEQRYGPATETVPGWVDDMLSAA
jgi:NAD-dependent deacetylase